MQWGPPGFSLSPVILECLQFFLRCVSPIPCKFFSLLLWALSAAGLVGNIQFFNSLLRYPQCEALVLVGTHSLLTWKILDSSHLWHSLITLTMTGRLLSYNKK